jgi:hypothetical protein
MTMELGEVKVSKLADIKKAKTDLVCPECGKKPTWKGGYDCVCGKHYNHWSQLKRILAQGEVVEKKSFPDSGIAQISTMNKAEFAKYSDACLSEYGLVASDTKSAKNIKKLLVASKILDKVIIANFNDDNEKRSCVLTTSISGRVILREIIPVNIASVRDTMTDKLDEISDLDKAEAQAFIKILPVATEANLITDDHRADGLNTIVEVGSVQVLEELIANK